MTPILCIPLSFTHSLYVNVSYFCPFLFHLFLQADDTAVSIQYVIFPNFTFYTFQWKPWKKTVPQRK